MAGSEVRGGEGQASCESKQLIPCLVALRDWVAWVPWAWDLVSVCWGTKTGGGAKGHRSHLPPLSPLHSGLLAACRISQVIPRLWGRLTLGSSLPLA